MLMSEPQLDQNESPFPPFADLASYMCVTDPQQVGFVGCLFE